MKEGIEGREKRKDKSEGSKEGNVRREERKERSEGRNEVEGRDA